MFNSNKTCFKIKEVDVIKIFLLSVIYILTFFHGWAMYLGGGEERGGQPQRLFIGS
jgi:hypothetical protein